MKKILLLSLLAFFVIIQLGFSQTDSIWIKDYSPREAITARFINQDTLKIIVGIKGDTGFVQMCEAISGNIIWDQTTSSVLALDISNDSSIVATAHSDTTIRIWDLNTGQLKKTYNRVLIDTLKEGLYAKFTSICFSNNGRYVYAAYNYYPSLNNINKAKLFRIDLQDDSIINKLTYDNQEIIKMSPTSDTLISTVGRYSYPAIAKINPNTLELDTILYVGQGGLLTDIAISPNGNYIATSSEDGTVKIWNMSDLSISKTFSTNEESVYYKCITFANDNNHIILSKIGGDKEDFKTYIINILNDSINYEYDYSPINDNDISLDDQYILFSGIFVKLYYSRNITGAFRDNQPEESNRILYPNPSTSVATIQYQQPFSEKTNIFITGINGQIVKPILNNFLEQGNKIIDFSTQNIFNGTYFVNVESTHLRLTFKLIVNK